MLFYLCERRSRDLCSFLSVAETYFLSQDLFDKFIDIDEKDESRTTPNSVRVQ